MTIQEAATILLAIRGVCLVLMFMVIIRQFRLFRMAIDTGLVQFRMVMFALGLVFLLSNILPIYVDYYFAFIKTDARWNGLLVAYAANNALSALASSYIIWKIYRIAGVSNKEKGV